MLDEIAFPRISQDLGVESARVFGSSLRSAKPRDVDVALFLAPGTDETALISFLKDRWPGAQVEYWSSYTTGNRPPPGTYHFVLVPHSAPRDHPIFDSIMSGALLCSEARHA